MKLSKSLYSFFNCYYQLALWYHLFGFITFIPTDSLSFREEAKVLGDIQELTCPHKVTLSARLAPSTTATASGEPQEPLVVKPETTTVNVMSSYSEWLTLGLPIDLRVLPPTKLPGNHTQHVCPFCGDIKMSSDRAYNHIWTEHVRVLLQCCFCSWSSGSAHMMREHILRFHQSDDGSCLIVGLEPTPRAACH